MKQPADDRARRADLASWDLVLGLDHSSPDFANDWGVGSLS
jgi:hypothetical protein